MKRPGLLGLLLLALAAVASAQFGGRKREKPKAPVVKSDIKFIRCQVCEAMVKQARRFAADLTAAAGAKKVHEADILDKLEKMCDPDLDEGDWIASLDIKEDGSSLLLKDTGSVGKCKSECRTIAKACEQIHEEADLTDLSAMLFKGKKRSAIQNWMCHESTDACTKKPPPVPKDRKPGEEHEPISADELQATKMMRNMKAAGLGGSMYSRDAMQEELAEMQEEYGDDPDFARAMAHTGLDNHLPPRPAEDDDAEPASAGDTVAAAAAKIQETATKAAEVVKDGAAKVVEGAKNFASKLFGSKKAEQGTEGGEL